MIFAILLVIFAIGTKYAILLFPLRSPFFALIIIWSLNILFAKTFLLLLFVGSKDFM